MSNRKNCQEVLSEVRQMRRLVEALHDVIAGDPSSRPSIPEGGKIIAFPQEEAVRPVAVQIRAKS